MNTTDSLPFPPDEEIELLELAKQLWSRKLLIGLSSLGAGVLALSCSFLMTPVYRAEVTIAPVSEERGAAASLSSQLGGLASLAGINLPSGGGSADANAAILKSRELATRFIEKEGLMPTLFEAEWDAVNRRWLETAQDKLPTQWKAYQLFDTGVRKIQEDKKTGIIKLSIDWKDPKLAAQWANGLVRAANEHIRQRAIREAEQSMAYLNEEVSKTSVVGMQEILYRLIEKQMQTVTLARARDEYAFAIIDKAVPPERKLSPKRGMIATVSSMTVGLLAALYVLVAARWRGKDWSASRDQEREAVT